MELGTEPDGQRLAEGASWGVMTTYGLLDVKQEVPELRGYAQLRANAIGVGGVHYAGGRAHPWRAASAARRT